MPLLSKTISGMYGGVSQQPPALRLDNQCEEMTNCFPSIVDGVYKRAPAAFVKALRDRVALPSDPEVATEAMRIHFIDRDAAEKYAVLFTGDATTPIEVYSLLDGTQKTVNYQDANAKAYAVTTDPEEDIKTLTIGDYTLVVNSSVTPAMSGTADGDWYPFAILNILHGVTGQTYNAYINGNKFTYTTTTDVSTYNTDYIALQLYNAMVTWVEAQTVPADWQVVYGGSSILIYNLNDDDFTFKVDDSWGNAAMVGIKEQAQKLEDLPNRLPDNATYGTDQFTVVSQVEYWTNVLMVEDPQNPGQYIDLGYSISGFGHGDSDIQESTDYWWSMCTKILTGADPGTPKGGHTGGYGIFYQPQPSDPYYSTSWQVSRDSDSVVTCWRTDGTRTKLYSRRFWNRDGATSPSVSPNDYIVISRHEVVDFTNMAIKVYETAASTDSLGYYLRWKTETSDGLEATGTWVETVAGGLDNNFDAETVPHQLVRESNGTFTFQRSTWNSRLVGDEDSSPNPSFIGNPITDVFFHKNRVGYLAGGSVIISKAGEYWDFYPTTALEVTDDDPIDITIPSQGVDALRWAAPSKGDLLIFGPEEQYILTAGDQVFGAKTVSMDSHTNFPISAICRPERCGANVYFASPKGAWSAVHEYFTQPNTLTDDAADVAAHVPQYLPAGVQYMAPSATFNLLFFCTGMDAKIYGYKYYVTGDQKAQSAWFTWTFPFTVKACRVIDNILYIIGDTGLQFTLHTLNLERVTDTGLEFLCHLDVRYEFDSTGTYSAVTGLTTFDLPYYLTEDKFDTYWTLVNLDTGKEVDGLTWVDEETLTVLGDYSSSTMLIGASYDQTYTFSEFGLPSSDQAKLFNPQGRLQVRTLTVAFQESVMFDCVVTPTGTAEGGRTAITHEYTGVEIGLTTLGSVPMPSGKRRFLVWGNSIGTTIQLVNSSHFPATWYEASWEGMYTIRSRTV